MIVAPLNDSPDKIASDRSELALNPLRSVVSPVRWFEHSDTHLIALQFDILGSTVVVSSDDRHGPARCTFTDEHDEVMTDAEVISSLGSHSSRTDLTGLCAYLAHSYKLFRRDLHLQVIQACDVALERLSDTPSSPA